jgi:hypothetical protein
MSGNTIANIAYAAFIAILGVILVCLCWEPKTTEAERVTAARARVGLDIEDEHDVGPDSLRLLEDLDAHLDNFVANDPEVKAGLARLHAAIHDERQEGESA